MLILSISQRDYNTIMGITVLISSAVLLATLVVDLLYAYLDPRIKDQYTGGKKRKKKNDKEEKEG